MQKLIYCCFFLIFIKIHFHEIINLNFISLEIVNIFNCYLNLGFTFSSDPECFFAEIIGTWIKYFSETLVQFLLLYLVDTNLVLLENISQTEEISLFLLFLLENLFTYDDCLLILYELESLNEFSNLVFFEENFSKLFFDNYQPSLIFLESLKLTDQAVIILNEFFIIQFFFLEIISQFLWQKVLIFFFFNFFLIFLLLWNLVWLAFASNLIHALLHFLFFAVLSGILIILWGGIYIGFCVLLIYGAAIPVLALYIIMLVNVDLIQRLFFVESLEFTNPKYKLHVLILLVTVSGFFYILTPNFNTIKLFELNFNDLLNNIDFLFLSRWYLSMLQFSYSTGTATDMSLLLNASDIDKVASAAFKISGNELLALVFLLLIAIIIVISISRPTILLDREFYESDIIKSNSIFKYIKFLTLLNKFMFFNKKQLGLFLDKHDLPHYGTSWDSDVDMPYYLLPLFERLWPKLPYRHFSILPLYNTNVKVWYDSIRLNQLGYLFIGDTEHQRFLEFEKKWLEYQFFEDKKFKKST